MIREVHHKFAKKQGDNISTEISAKADMMDCAFNASIKADSKYGLCSKCVNLALTKTEFKIVRAICTRFHRLPLFLNESTPIEACTEFEKRGEMSLYEMRDLATIIEIPKDKIGF